MPSALSRTPPLVSFLVGWFWFEANISPSSSAEVRNVRTLSPYSNTPSWRSAYAKRQLYLTGLNKPILHLSHRFTLSKETHCLRLSEFWCNSKIWVDKVRWFLCNCLRTETWFFFWNFFLVSVLYTHKKLSSKYHQVCVYILFPALLNCMWHLSPFTNYLHNPMFLFISSL
jgi:hypothetical protein